MAALLLLFLVSRFDIDFASTGDRIRSSNPMFYLLALLLYYTTFLFRGARWRLLLANAGVDREAALPSLWAAGRLILLGWMVSAVSWFRMGDAYRAYAYHRECNAPLARSLGTVLAERVLDVATIFVLLVVAFLLLYVDAERRPSQLFLFAGAGLLVAAGLSLVVLQLLQERVARFLPEWVQGVYHSLHQGIMGSFRRLPLVALLGLLGWLSEVGRLYFVVQSTGLQVGIGLIVFVTIANAILSAVPFTPGGLGIAGPGIAGLLALEVAREDAITLAVLDRSISYLSLILFGAIAFVIHQQVLARRRRASATLAEGKDWQAGAREG